MKINMIIAYSVIICLAILYLFYTNCHSISKLSNATKEISKLYKESILKNEETEKRIVELKKINSLYVDSIIFLLKEKKIEIVKKESIKDYSKSLIAGFNESKKVDTSNAIEICDSIVENYNRYILSSTRIDSLNEEMIVKKDVQISNLDSALTISNTANNFLKENYSKTYNEYLNLSNENKKTNKKLKFSKLKSGGFALTTLILLAKIIIDSNK